MESQWDELLFSVSTFLEPPSDVDIQAMKMSEDAFRNQLWKCKRSVDFVQLGGFGQDAVDDAKSQCLANDDTNAEPVGGQGGIVRTPIRDDFLPSQLFDARQERSLQREHDASIINLLIIVLVVIVVMFVWGS